MAGFVPKAGARKSIRVVMDDTYPPYIFRAPDGALKGILVDQWALWARQTGIKVQLDAMDWARAQRRMEAGDYDVIDTIFETKSRERLYDFTPPYARIDVPLFFSKDLSGIQGPGDLSGFVVGAKRGDNSINTLQAEGVSHFLLFDNYEAIIAAARDGKVKVFTVDQPPALYYLIKMGIQDRFRQSAPLYSGEFRRAVRKGDTVLLNIVQQGFAAIPPTEFQQTWRRWYGTPIFSQGQLRITAIVAGTSATLLGLLLLWVWSLRRMVERRTAEARRNETALQASELITKTINSHFTNGMIYQVLIDARGIRRFTYLSESVNSLYGVSATEAMADASLIYRKIHPDDSEALRRAEGDAIRSGSRFQFEARVLDPQGRIRWSSFLSTPRVMPDGSTYWDGMEFIITERKQGEEALRESEAQYRSLIRAIPDLIFRFSRSGEYLAIHAADPELLVEPEAALLHRNVTEALPGPLAQQFLKALGDALDSNAVQELNYCILLAGKTRFFEARFSPCPSQMVVAIVRDITESKRREEQQSQFQAQVQRTQKLDSLGSLAGGVAHDMNNVLGAILAIASSNLESGTGDERLRRGFETITKAATRGGQMVKRLLNFARSTPVEEVAVDLNTVILEVARLLERTTLSWIHLDFDLAPQLRPIRGDSGSLAHLVMNLCVNAVDAMAGNGTLTLRTRNLDADSVLVAVADTGSGMAREVLDRALDPFFTTKDQGKGTGLGLSIVHSTVQAHHGQLEIQSEPGKGTCVVMRFPAYAPPVLDQEPGPGLSDPIRIGRKILVVDDDDLIQNGMEMLLATLGHVATIAASGEEALASLEAGLAADVVILDMNMPGLGGSGTLPRLRALRPALPVLLATGRVDQAALNLIAADPRTTLLSKPFNLEEVKRLLAAVLPAPD